MPAPLTVVIPALNAAGALPETAAALLPGVTTGLISELIVSDGGSDDGTADIARELGARLVAGDPGRGPQIARGVAAAKTDWVLILHTDTHLSPEWLDAAARHISHSPEAAGYFQLQFRAAGLMPRLVETGANWRARVFQLPYGDQGLLVRRAVLADVGGVPEIPLMEDVELATRLKGRLVPLDARAMTSAERYQAQGWVRRMASNLWFLTRFKLGTPPEVLARKY